MSTGVGEVQEYIDMCDLAVGMSRQLPGEGEERDFTVFAYALYHVCAVDCAASYI